MKFLKNIFLLFIVCTFVYTACKKPYEPPAIKADNKFLVVDGILVSSTDSPSVITLSRTIKLTDTTTSSSPETGATVAAETVSGATFNFYETTPGVYKANPAVLNNSEKYHLKITTTSGGEYESDFVEVKQTPPIDSITWQQNNDVMIYADTHDPQNNTKYYRWDYIETWQYRAKFERTIAQKNGVIFYVDSTNETYNCWSNANSTKIITASTIALSHDVVSKEPITIIPQNSDKIGVRYSILVKQYALTTEAYQYLEILKKNTEELGSIFDAQPTQLIGNIHSVKNPSEIVIGFFSASSVEQKRIFINTDDLSNWNTIYEGRSCDIVKIPQDPNNYLLYNYSDTAFEPYYFSTMPNLIVLTRTSCVDCTTRGGTTTRPSFW